MGKKLNCPVDFKLVNEYKIRFIAAFVFILSAIYVWTGIWVIMLFLSIDFFLRAFGYPQYSLLGIMSSKLVNLFNLGTKLIDQGPKRFAALIGFIMVSAIVIFHVTGFFTIASILAFAIILFSFLESVFGICAGCHMYTFFHKMKRRVKVV